MSPISSSAATAFATDAARRLGRQELESILRDLVKSHIDVVRGQGGRDAHR